MALEVVVPVLILLFVLLAIGTQIAFALGISGVVGIVLLQSLDSATSSLGAIPFFTTARYSWIVVPLFIFMGMMAMHGRIAEDLYLLLSRVLRNIPGSLGVATVLACAGFAAVSGSSLATAATVGRMSIGEMRRHGYPARFASGLVAAAGTLGVLIPPSIFLVLYALIAGESIGQLLVAGIAPGLLSALAYGLYIILWDMRRKPVDPTAPGRPASARPPSGGALAERSGRLARWVSVREQASGLRACLLVAAIFLLVVGGVYTGAFTVTAAAAMGAFACVVVVPFHLHLRPGQEAVRLLPKLWDAARESASTTSMVFWIVIGASIFTNFFVLARVPSEFAGWVTGLDVPPMMIVVLVLLALIPLGMFLDPLSILLISVPLAYPAVTALGFDGVWFGILVVKAIELGMITPPLGMNAYVVAGSSPDLSPEDVFAGVWPFGLVDVAVVGLLLAFPGIVLWLPSVMRG